MPVGYYLRIGEEVDSSGFGTHDSFAVGIGGDVFMGLLD